METLVNSLMVNGVEYVRKDSVSATSIPKGNRVVVVVNHGWIYAGNVSESNGRITLTNAVWVFNWSSIGFAEVLRNPKHSNVDIRKMEYPVDIPAHSEVYRIPVPEGWGF
jgi:hypothetical protein